MTNNTNNFPYKAVIHIEGMSCAHCVQSVKNAFNNMGLSADVDLAEKQAVVYMNEKLSDDVLLKTVRDLGFEPSMMK